MSVDIMSNLYAMAASLNEAAPAKGKAAAPKITVPAPDGPVHPIKAAPVSAPVAAPVAVAVAPAPVVLPAYAPPTVVPHVVLSNGETFCAIDGCKVILIPDDAESFTDEDMASGLDLKTLYEAYVALQTLKALLS